MSRALNNVFKLAVRRDVERDFGAVNSFAVDSGAALQAAFDWAAGSPEREVTMWGTGYLSQRQLSVHRARVTGRSELRFSGVNSSTDLLVLQGSLPNQQLVWEGVQINANGCGRDAVVAAGGKAGAANSDFMRLRGFQILNAVRDGLHFENGGASQWTQNFDVEDVKIMTPGRHGIAMIVPNLSGVFCNQGEFRNVDVRGAGQTTAGAYDVYADSQGTTSSQKISEIKFTGCDLDTMGAPNHAQGSVSLNQTGSSSSYAGWYFDEVTFEDTGSTITGFPDMIQVGAGVSLPGLYRIGGCGSKYGRFIDPTKVTGPYIHVDGTTGRGVIVIDGPVSGTGFKPGGAAQSDLNTLDRYAWKQTFTPTITLGGGNTGITYATQYGYYQQIGDTIYFRLRVILTSKGTSTGSLLIQLTGLPPIADTAFPSASVFAQNLGSGFGAAPMALVQTGPAIKLLKLSAGVAIQLADTDLTNTSDFAISGHYHG
jgi:hypothetical protein